MHPVAVKRSGRISEVLCDGETLNDFLEVLPMSNVHRSQRESLPNQAAIGV
jgi:hypothetical protein